MQRLYVFLLLVGISCTAYLYYTNNQDACHEPISYRIGNIDERFGMSHEEAKRALMQAEHMWENAAGLELFVRSNSQDAELVVNFIFDERQEETREEQRFREEINQQKEELSGSTKRYEKLEEQFNQEKDTFDTLVKQYEEAVSRYNTQVTQGVLSMSEAQQKQEELDLQYDQIQNQERVVNNLVVRINQIVDRSSQLVESYNKQVDSYNRNYAGTTTFDQGDYSQNGNINIYQYENFDDLVLVLAHEFGHALGLTHASDKSAVMHAVLLEQQLGREFVTDADIRLLEQECELLR